MARHTHALGHQRSSTSQENHLLYTALDMHTCWCILTISYRWWLISAFITNNLTSTTSFFPSNFACLVCVCVRVCGHSSLCGAMYPHVLSAFYVFAFSPKSASVRHRLWFSEDKLLKKSAAPIIALNWKLQSNLISFKHQGPHYWSRGMATSGMEKCRVRC